MMNQQLVTYETAKLAKAKGFIEKVINIFVTNFQSIKSTSDNPIEDAIVEKEGGVYETYIYTDMEQTINTFDIFQNNKYQPEFVARPSQAHLQKWLRDRGIDVIVNPVRFVGCENIEYWKYAVLGVFEYKLKFNSYEEALEVGLFKGLELIESNETI